MNWIGPICKLRRVSSLYETEPIGLREQRWFLNLVAEFETDLFPKQLLHRMQKIETEHGTQANGAERPAHDRYRHSALRECRS